jgi:hypothetical protein
LGQVKEEEGMPKRFENPVEVTAAVFDGLETVQESRETSMLDHHQAVQDIADRLDYPETASWVRENRQAYLEGVSRGFVVAE